SYNVFSCFCHFRTNNAACPANADNDDIYFIQFLCQLIVLLLDILLSLQGPWKRSPRNQFCPTTPYEVQGIPSFPKLSFLYFHRKQGPHKLLQSSCLVKD